MTSKDQINPDAEPATEAVGPWAPPAAPQATPDEPPTAVDIKPVGAQPVRPHRSRPSR
ncbi:hypothetical protein KZ829_20320 [Actinoplanes hulinensis]|uniref:Uncharacterized protein n=1 Tax=Actinoplanes hulinensis TaxID=1144547 RepID=A0ABS7B6J7_9ACTN|nr:hypothetical protein [Actinoplanes hulinensis]MBW6436089.1 hypothetical protein [Actinoplanes hulinensis]